jgi:hypothetical protein
MQASSRWDLTRGDLCSRLHARATDSDSDFHFTNRRVLVSFFLFRPHRGVSGDQPIRPGSPETNSVRACPQRTQAAPIYSAQIRPSRAVRKRPQLGWELRDPTRVLSNCTGPELHFIQFVICGSLSLSPSQGPSRRKPTLAMAPRARAASQASPRPEVAGCPGLKGNLGARPLSAPRPGIMGGWDGTAAFFRLAPSLSSV